MNKKKNLITSVQVSDPEYFSYLLKTDVGKVLAEGDVSADECVRFDEMSEDACYSRLERFSEVYMTKVATYSCGTGGKTCTRVVKKMGSRG